MAQGLGRSGVTQEWPICDTPTVLCTGSPSPVYVSTIQQVHVDIVIVCNNYN